MCTISIHALRMEGDQIAVTADNIAVRFLPTPSAWRATVRRDGEFVGDLISIHALRMEGDPIRYYKRQSLDISIHALRMEGDRIRKEQST